MKIKMSEAFIESYKAHHPNDDITTLDGYSSIILN